jgi:lipopolysaccharide biosynthesis glycosyltransferase
LGVTEPRREPIHLLLAADARYGRYAGIAIASVLASNPRQRFLVHLFSNGIRRSDLRKLRHLLNRAGGELTVYDVVGKLAASRPPPARGHLNATAYARLMMGELLPATVRRVIYLDCDVICTGELWPLWQLADSVAVLGAVFDRTGERWKALLGLSLEAQYFNSGVLIVNLDGWRQRDAASRIVKWIAANPAKATLADQDAINACLQGEITPLPECWNLQIGQDSGPLPAERLKDGVLLHYTGEHKPWRFRFAGLGAEIFLRHKRRSPWRFALPAFRLSYRLKKSLNKRLARWRAAPVPRPRLTA